MEVLQAQIASELGRIRPFIEEMTGLPSRWSGIVELVPNAEFKGKKPFRCDILINAELARQPYRWTTLIHEMLHSVSAGYLRDDYQDFQGWEEGVVEQVQRFLRPRILTHLRISAEQETLDMFRRLDEGHAYNDFIAAIERLRVLVSAEDAETFYLRLLATPIRSRPPLLLDFARTLQGDTRRQFISGFSAANASLRTRRAQGNLMP